MLLSSLVGAKPKPPDYLYQKTAGIREVKPDEKVTHLFKLKMKVRVNWY